VLAKKTVQIYSTNVLAYTEKTMAGITLNAPVFNTHFSRLEAVWARTSRWMLPSAQCRQIVIDVVIVSGWAALIPSLLWLGHWMGY